MWVQKTLALEKKATVMTNSISTEWRKSPKKFLMIHKANKEASINIRSWLQMFNARK